MWPIYDLWGLGWWDFHTFPDTRKLPGQAQRQPTAHRETLAGYLGCGLEILSVRTP